MNSPWGTGKKSSTKSNDEVFIQEEELIAELLQTCLVPGQNVSISECGVIDQCIVDLGSLVNWSCY